MNERKLGTWILTVAVGFSLVAAVGCTNQTVACGPASRTTEASASTGDVQPSYSLVAGDSLGMAVFGYENEVTPSGFARARWEDDDSALATLEPEE